MTGLECNLGDIVKDSITGLKGTVIAKTEWLNGCWRIIIQPNEIKEGRPVDPSTFDVEQLVMVKAKNVAMPAKRTGGDRPDPSARPSAASRR
jgi:hypothetical protein